ncbi:hypothetical protein RISW2_12865 [Roseivivax isoporae LMG 25204]|uniref:DUF4864 domain-containing protein n=1 Tax=Roseivivax isoporae LMG 25204 TaxID=1449351 RepID=X7FCV9_9RHOB|nr:hypothetical protein RISW2_12865 [Roseivivax isoporae LMG 25204]
MRTLVLAAALAVATLATAQDSRGGDIEAVISGQMEAFRNDDVATAFGFAAPMIQNMFRTPENFGLMVERGYPMVWRPAEVTFGDLFEEGGILWQRVIVRDAAGAVHVLDYDMRDMGGAWRIGGVRVVAQPDLSA